MIISRLDTSDFLKDVFNIKINQIFFTILESDGPFLIDFIINLSILFSPYLCDFTRISESYRAILLLKELLALKEVVDKYIDYLACGLANMINIFQPEVLSIGGGVCNEKDYLMVPLLRHVEREQYTRDNKNKTKVMITEPCDSMALERHIYDIAMGTVTQDVRTAEGKIIKIPPSFKDQISAASIYFKTEEARQKRVLTTEKEIGSTSGVSLIAEETKVLLSRFNLRDYGFHREASRDRGRGGGIG